MAARKSSRSPKEPNVQALVMIEAKPGPKPSTRSSIAAEQPRSPAETRASSSSGALKAPTAEYLISLRREKQSDFGEQDQQIDAMRRQRELKEPVVLPEGCRFVDIEVRDPTISDEISRVVATLTLNRPTLQVTTSREGEGAEKNTTLRQDATEEILWQAGTRLAGRNTFRDSTDYCAGDGGAWTKLLFTKDTWDERYALRRSQFSLDDGSVDDAAFTNAADQTKKGSGVPFAFLAVDPRTVYPIWAQGKLTEVLEVSTRGVHQALRQYRLGFDKMGKLVPDVLGLPMNEVDGTRIPQTVTFYEHWDDTWATYVCEGSYGDAVVVKQFRHRMGRVPYFFAPGFVFPWHQNVKVGWGIAQSKLWLVQYLSFLLTLHAQSAARDTFAPFYRTLDPKSAPIMGKNGAPIATEKYKLGQIVNGPPGSSLAAFPFPATSTALKEQIAYIAEKIEKLLTPRVTHEIGSGLEGAGFAMNQVLSEAKIYADPIAQSIEQMLTDVTKFLWHLIRTRVKETVWVEQSTSNGGWLGLGPDDLQAGVGVKWTLDPERPSAKLIEERYWHERIDKGTASHAMAIKAMGDNPEEVRFERDLEAMRQEPWYIAYRQQYILKQLGRGDILAKAAKVATTTGGLPGVPMQPIQNAAAGAIAAQGMGSAGIPDMGQLAIKPGGMGPATLPTPGGGPQPVPMQSLGGAPPSQSAAAGLNQLAA